VSASETPSDGLCDSEPKSQPVKAAIWIIGAMASFTSMAIAGREVSVELDTFELMLFRSLIGIVIVVSIGAWSGRLGQVRTKRIGLHIVRNIFHFAGQNLWFYAVALIPFAQLFALEFTVPLWVALLAPFVLAERMTAARVLAALIGFAGSVIGTKILSRTETTLSILFWLTIIQAGLGVVFASLDGGISLPSSSALPWIVLVGCAGLLAHFCLTNALRLAPATIVAPLDFARLPIIAVIGLVFYNEPLSLFVFAGAILVFGANFLNIWSEQRRIG